MTAATPDAVLDFEIATPQPRRQGVVATLPSELRWMALVYGLDPAAVKLRHQPLAFVGGRRAGELDRPDPAATGSGDFDR